MRYAGDSERRGTRELRAGLFLAAAAILPPLGGLLVFSYSGGVPDGLRVHGAPLDDGEVDAQLARRAEAWGRRRLRVGADGTFRRPTRTELGARVDREAMRARVARFGHTHRLFEDARSLLSAYAGAVDLRWEVRVDEARARRYLAELARSIDRPPRGPRFDARGRLLELSADGARLEQAAALEALRAALARGAPAVELPVTRIPSGLGDAAVAARPPARRSPVVLGRYATDYRERERSRSRNVVTAAEALDGARIPAHGRLSFNRRVGARSRERGYVEAHVIVDGEMVDGLGGGVCQVASTLHAAAFVGGFDILEHAPHSRPSAYIPMGLDATVVWPNVDLVLGNPHPFEVEVRAWAEGGQMVVELLGARRMRTVDWRRETLATEPWSDRYVEDPAVPPGQERVSQAPIRGFTILRERTLQDATGVHLEERRIRYPPTDRIVRVAPGTLDIPYNPYSTP